MKIGTQLFADGVAVAVAAGCSLAGTAFAQTSPTSGPLSSQPGLNDVQLPTAVAIETLCPRLAPPNPQGTPEQRLRNSCATLLRNASNPATPAALQAVAPEEIHAAGRVATTSPGGSPVSGRLLTLRSRGRGLMLADSGLSLNGLRLSAADLLPAGSRGGGAAADTELGSRWGGFINGNYNTGDHDDSSREDRFEFDDAGLTAGVDYRISDAFVAGLAGSWSETDVDFKNNLGSIDTTNWGVTAYGSYTMGNWYFDGQLAFSRMDYDTRRNIVSPALGFNTTAKGSTDGDQMTLSIGGGYEMRTGNLTVTPYGRLDYLRLEVDSFTETEEISGLGLDVNSQTTESLQSAIGARISTPISTGVGVFMPYATVEWNHEYENDSEGLAAKYTHDPFNTFFVIPSEEPDRNFFTVGLGVAATFQRGLSAFVNVDTVLGLSRTDAYAVTVGVRAEF